MMVVAALLIIITQGLIIWLLLKCVNSFGAFTSALIRTHDANVRVHESNAFLVEEQNRLMQRIRRVADQLSDRNLGVPSSPPPQDMGKSA